MSEVRIPEGLNLPKSNLTEFPTLEFTDSGMRFADQTYRLFTKADLAKAQLMGSYDKVFGAEKT